MKNYSEEDKRLAWSLAERINDDLKEWGIIVEKRICIRKIIKDMAIVMLSQKKRTTR